jgi:hypothetical protein
MNKPIRLEINDSGSWRTIGRFDAADDEQTASVMAAAEQLVHALWWDASGKCATLRASIDATNVLLRWTYTTGWRDALTGDPA